MPESFKIIIRIWTTASEIAPADFIPVFHRLIQKQAVPDHLLIDVADYAHVSNGPGTILISSEANIHADRSDGKLGISYVRKRPIDGAETFEQALTADCQSVATIGDLLATDEAMAGRLTFEPGHWSVRLNDRLATPNSDATKTEYGPRIAAGLSAIGSVTVTPIMNSANELAEFDVRLTPA